MKNCIFTICAKNYIGLAQVLEKSIKKTNPECLFYIFVADELPDIDTLEVPKNVFECRKVLKDFINEDKWNEMSFKYNLTEFCTSIKPFCFEYLFKKLNFDKSIFLDPDIFVFSSFNSVFSELDRFKIILTPHIITFNANYKGDRSEKGILSTGVFNLGFLALRKSEEVDKMLSWWGVRLKMQCYIDVLDSYFTDQRWMDFLPCFFDASTLSVSHHLGLNVAPWNFFEREIYNNNGSWYVRIRREININEDFYKNHKTDHIPLIFVHFSGYDYKNLILGKVVQNNIPDLAEYIDIDNICILYSEFLQAEKETFNSYIKFPYTYNSYSNGIQITHFQRRIFRSLADEGEFFPSPFSINSGSFYAQLSKKKILIKSTQNNVDGLNKLNMPNSNSKLKKINWLMRIIFKLIGIKNYSLLIRLLRPYSRIENQIHLLNSKYGEKLK